MEASEIDWETINANLPFEHNEESHAQRRWLMIAFLFCFLFLFLSFVEISLKTLPCRLNTMSRITLREVGWKIYRKPSRALSRYYWYTLSWPGKYFEKNHAQKIVNFRAPTEKSGPIHWQTGGYFSIQWHLSHYISIMLMECGAKGLTKTDFVW